MNIYKCPLSLFTGLAKSRKPGALLGLDVGTKYVGVAVSDTNRVLASPYCVLNRDDINMVEMALELQRLMKDLSLLGIIVGYPYNRGRFSPDATQVKKFVLDLGKTKMLNNVKLAYWEESFTSKQAELVSHPFQFEAKEKKLMSDKFAATFILQGYLDAVNKANKQRGTYPKPF